MNLKLVRLTPAYRPQLEDMMAEWLAAEQNFSPYAIRKNDYRDFDYYLEHLEQKEAQGGKVPDSVFFCLDTERNRFVGAVNIRHYLTEQLLFTGGHIGDGVRPGERRKGVATAMIGLALEECRKLGISRVLMTCDADNIGSAKSIMNNGGVLENEVINEDGIPEQRYWIDLEKPGRTTVIFVRHAQPVHSHKEDRTRPLTEEGRADTQLVLDTLKGRKIDAFYCSPYLRSLDTIRSTAAYFNMPITTDARFRERESGEGNTIPLMRKRWEDFSWHEENGESIGMVQQRNIAALQELLEKEAGKTIVIGTHGTALSSILKYYNNHFNCDDFLRIIDWMPYLLQLEFEGQKLVHLQELAHIEKEFNL